MDARERNHRIESPKKGLSRRRFLQAAAGALTAGILLRNGVSPAAVHADSSMPEPTIPPPTRDPAEPLALPWNSIRENVGKLQYPERLREKIQLLQEGYEYRTNRINRLVELTYNGRKDSDGSPFLITQIKKITATQTSGIPPEQLLPFLREKQEVARKFGELESAVGTLAQNQPGTFASVINAVDRQLEDPMLQIPEKRQFPAQRLTIQPTSPIESEEARLEFERNKKQIEAFIDTFALFRKIYANILLYKDSYGIPKPAMLEGKGGLHLSEFTKENNLPICMVNLDHIDRNLPFTEKQFAHEAFGHAGSILPFPKYQRSVYEEGNKTLAEALSPEGYIERLTFELEILNNPDWANHSGTIDGILKEPRIPREDMPLTTDDFGSLIRSYPQSYAFDQTEGRIIAKDVLAKMKKGDLPGSKAFVGVSSKEYKSFKDFIADCKDALEQDAAGGNVESHIVLWGLSNFPEEFSRFAPNPLTFDADSGNASGGASDDGDIGNQKETIPDALGEDYVLYCRTFVSNMTLYHTFMNGDDKQGEQTLRNLFPADVQTELAKVFLGRRISFLTELWADGVAYSHTRQTAENPPFREGLKQLAWLLVDEKKAA